MNKKLIQVLPLAGLGAAIALMLSGCGGATTNGSPLAPTPDSGPVIYGINALAIDSGNASGETSGLSFTDPTSGTETGAIIGATTYKTLNGAGPIPEYQGDFPNTGTTPLSSPGLPLGFAVGGIYYNVGSPVAAIPTNYTGNLTFGVYVSTGVLNNRPVDLNTTSIVLTSSEAPGFSLPLTFDPNFGNGVLAQAEYKTAAFAVPAFLKTTGLHNLHTTVSDTSSQASTTDFSVLSLAPTDSAALVQVNFTNSKNQTAPVAGAVATITNALPGVAAYKDSTAPTGADALPTTTSYADAQGNILLFAAPGPQTITVTGVSPFDGTTVVTGTLDVTLEAGVTDTTESIDTKASTATAAAKTIARVKLLRHKKK